MKYARHCREKGRANHDKWVCDCKEPCSTVKKGRTIYTYDNMDFRMFPGIQRDSKEWDST